MLPHPLLTTVSLLPLLTPLVHSDATCNVACDQYNLNLENTYNLNPIVEESPSQGQISTNDVEYLCGDGNTLTCYECGGLTGIKTAQYQLLVNWAGVCQTSADAGGGQPGYAAGAQCWNSGFASADCAAVPPLDNEVGSSSTTLPAAAASSGLSTTLPVTAASSTTFAADGLTTPAMPTSAPVGSSAAAPTTIVSTTASVAATSASTSPTAASGADISAYPPAIAWLALLAAVLWCF